MKTKIEQLRHILSQNSTDSLFLSDQHNVSYLTGFSGLSPNEREGFFLVTKKSAYLLTFPTYFGMYKGKNDTFQTLCITSTKRLSDHLSEILKKDSCKNMGIEKQNLTLSEFESLQKKLTVLMIQTENIVEKLRIIKSEEEITKIKKAARIADETFTSILPLIKEGISEKKLAVSIESSIKMETEDVSFSPIVAFDQSAAIPHYMPNPNVIAKKQSLILLDFGAKYNGYCSDMTRVVFIGTPKASDKKIYDTVLEAQKKALNALVPGVTGAKIDGIARTIIENAHFPVYQHGLGHGVGTAIHEDPKLRQDSVDVLQENMVVTVEPGIYIEGSCGVRIEDLVVLRKDGAEILSHSSKELIIL